MKFLALLASALALLFPISSSSQSRSSAIPDDAPGASAPISLVDIVHGPAHPDRMRPGETLSGQAELGRIVAGARFESVASVGTTQAAVRA